MRSCAVERSYFAHLPNIESAVRVFLAPNMDVRAAALPVAPLTDHVRKVFFLSSDEEMSRIVAGAIITGMANQQSLRDGADNQTISSSRHDAYFRLHALPKVDDSVPVPCYAERPVEAFI